SSWIGGFQPGGRRAHGCSDQVAGRQAGQAPSGACFVHGGLGAAPPPCLGQWFGFGYAQTKAAYQGAAGEEEAAGANPRSAELGVCRGYAQAPRGALTFIPKSQEEDTASQRGSRTMA